jgi:Zn-finger nucleic acid-binding protein
MGVISDLQKFICPECANKPGKAGFIEYDVQCPKCGGVAYVLRDGSVDCFNCGWQGHI